SLKARLNVDERVTELADGVGERGDACLDLGRVVPIPGLGGDVVAKRLGIEITKRRRDVDIAKPVPFALVHGEGDEERFPVRRQLGDGRYNPEIRIALFEVEVPQR